MLARYFTTLALLALAALILKNLLSRSQKSVLHRNVALIAKILLAVSLAAALLELAIRKPHDSDYLRHARQKCRTPSQRRAGCTRPV